MLFFKMLFLIFCHLLLQLWMFILNMGKVNDNNNEVCKPNLQIAVHALIFFYSLLCVMSEDILKMEQPIRRR